MAASTSVVQVSSAPELESAVASYISQGFVVSNRTPDGVLMFKKKEFNIIWAVVGALLCALPLVIYLIVYATQSDRMVEIRLAGAGAGAVPQLAGAPAPVEPQMSDDRHYWWDGSEWRRADEEVPPGARRSDDGYYWWDGVEWRPVPQAASAADETPTTLWAPPATTTSETSPAPAGSAASPAPATLTDDELDDLVVIKRRPDLPGPSAAE